MKNEINTYGRLMKTTIDSANVFPFIIPILLRVLIKSFLTFAERGI